MLEKMLDDNWKVCDDCKQEHYIPKNKRFCLPCMKKHTAEENNATILTEEERMKAELDTF